MSDILPLPVVQGGFGTIVADPPWSYTAGQTTRIAPTYETMTMADLLEMPIGALAAPQAHLYLWVTSSFLAEGLALMRAWGFEYKTSIVWAKGRLDLNEEILDRCFVEGGRSFAGMVSKIRERLAHVLRFVPHIGMGSYVRCTHELVLLGTRGGLTGGDRSLGSVIIAPRGQHSAKPEELQDLAEDNSPGPRLELFARRARAGWTSWGNEAPRD